MEIKTNDLEAATDHIFQKGGYLNFEDFCDTKHMNEEEVQMIWDTVNVRSTDAWNKAIGSAITVAKNVGETDIIKSLETLLIK